MKKRSDTDPDWESQRIKIIGLGESSIRKSYFPELQQRITDLEEKNRELETAYAEQTSVSEELRQQMDETAKTEQELRRSEERFRNVLDASPVPIVLTREGRFLYVNQAFCRIAGYDSLADVVGRDLLDFVAPEFRQKVDAFARARSRGEPAATHYESIGVRKDGSRFPYEISIAVIELYDGPVTIAFIADISARKAAEEAIAKSDIRLKRAELIAGIGHWEFHLDSNTVQASDGARIIYGLFGEKWSIPDVQKIPLPEYRAKLDEALRALVHEGRPYDIEFRIRRPSDNAIVDIHSIAEYDSHARIVFGVIQDITERRKVEVTLRESEMKYRDLVETSPDGIWEVDTSGRFTYLSPKNADMLGYEVKALQGKTFFDILHPDSVAATSKLFLEAVRDYFGLVTVEVVATHADGHPIDLEIRAAGATDDQGRLRGFRGISRDITERRKAVAALRESEEKFRNITQFTPLGMHMYHLQDDGSLILIGANPAADAILGVKHAPLAGKTIEEVFPAMVQTRIPEQYRKVAATGEPWQSDEVTYKDGQVEGSFSVYAFQISSGNMVAMFRDITEARRAVFSLEQARKKLNLLNTVTFQDIQSAAFSLSAYHILINKQVNDPLVLSYLDKESVLVQKIITTLNFAKDFQDMGIQTPRWQNISQTFLYAISHLDFLKISHTTELGDLEIYADPLLEKAFSNLMENVIRHGKSATTVRLWYEEKPDGLHLFVEDNGVGIPREEKQMIFDRSYGKDTGLGLFLVREILSITGMTIRETGEYGKGARFEINVPQNGYRFKPVK